MRLPISELYAISRRYAVIAKHLSNYRLRQGLPLVFGNLCDEL